MSRFSPPSPPLSPLEHFVRDYVEARDGAWEEIEPQLYDVLIGSELVRVAFDAEAIPEHPQAQLASFASPLIDRLLNDAGSRWKSGVFYHVGGNLQPHDLAARLRRAITLGADTSIQITRLRPMHFPQAFFWFTATFSGDEKEEEILQVGIDLHYLREVRHGEGLMELDRLCEQPQMPLPQVRHEGLVCGYRVAQGHVARTVASLANARRREWSWRVERQIARMTAYYARLREESEEQARRDEDPAAVARAAQRRQGIDHQEQLRITELRNKSDVRVQLKLASLMIVFQPKLLVTTTVAANKRPDAKNMELVWDPLSESFEAVPCPHCGRPTFSLHHSRSGLRCDECRNVAGM